MPILDFSRSQGWTVKNSPGPQVNEDEGQLVADFTIRHNKVWRAKKDQLTAPTTNDEACKSEAR